ncbi:hypothetical protein HYH02_002692 [Chlamydomonas schloesseri]|uniref:Flagellar associated protein n=1 Tax=Chlamydomonas schloesseri TaxID=2026947 RepID=A0A836BAV7_9CHLO|nr:hypothetical protein HYH02_002692 [Chlamydomonas schloesseri]|eukprot:KAG2452450.1 hypothetical protein HYH02_002692 [Chlamydomonas schloesseri]
MVRVGPTGQVVPRLLPLDVRRDAERQYHDSVESKNGAVSTDRRDLSRRASAASGVAEGDDGRQRPACPAAPSPPASIPGVPSSRLRARGSASARGGGSGSARGSGGGSGSARGSGGGGSAASSGAAINSSTRPSEASESTPFSTAAAQRAAQPTSNAAPTYAARAPDPAPAAPTAPAPQPQPTTSRSLTGVELARIALSSCSRAEAALMEASAASARSARSSTGYPGSSSNSPVWLPGIGSVSSSVSGIGGFGAGGGGGGGLLPPSMSARNAPSPLSPLSPLSPSPLAPPSASGPQGFLHTASASEMQSTPPAAAAAAAAGLRAPGRQQQSLMAQLQQQARVREQQQQQQQQQAAAQVVSAPQPRGSPSPERRGGWAKLAGAPRVPAGAGPRVGWGMVSGQHIATAADRPSEAVATAADRPSGAVASAAASNLALRLVQGLQERDEFSLVAAARQRSQRKPPAASRSMIFHATAGAAAANAAAATVAAAAAAAAAVVAAADDNEGVAAAASASAGAGDAAAKRFSEEGEAEDCPSPLKASHSLRSDLYHRANSCPAMPAFQGLMAPAATSPGPAAPRALPSPLGASGSHGSAAAGALPGGADDGDRRLPAGDGVASGASEECASRVFPGGALTLPQAEEEGWSGSSQSVPLPQISLTTRAPGATAVGLGGKLRRASAFVPDSPRLGMLLLSSPSTWAGGDPGGALSLSSDGGDHGLLSSPDAVTAARRLGSELSMRSVAANPAAQAAAARSRAAADAAAAAADAAAALAAVRALESRYGSAVAPDAQLLALEQEAAFRDRSRKLHEALQAANPAAYSEEAAEAAEAAYRALAERAKLRLRRLLAEPTTDQAAARQLQNAVRELGSQRPFFQSPVLQKVIVERPFTEKRQVVVKEVVWTLDDSIFAQRKKENEARDLFDTEKVLKQQLSLDWQRIVSKSRFRRLVARGDAGVKNDGQSLDEELGEVRDELDRMVTFIRSAFLYYSMKDGNITTSDVLQMGSNAWLNFCNDAGIVHPTQRGCTVQDLQTIFISVNFEEESDTTEADANDDDAMVRFEFMEGIVRAAFGKYIASKKCTDASDAVGMLLEEISNAPDLPPEAKVEPNDFRRHRFYTRQVEAVLKEYYDLLLGMYKLYKARDRSRLFWPEHWAAFLDSNKLLGLATGVERREAKLIYGWSQALVTDELRRRQRAVSLTFWDFVEAVARLADLISAPDHEDIIAYFLEEGEEPPELDRLVYEYYRHVGDAGTDRKRASAELVASPSRPLEVKLRLLLEYLVVSLREAWGGKDAKDVATKVLKMATYLSGGIEMG